MENVVGAGLLLGVITFLYRYSFVSPYGKFLAQKIPESFLMLLAPAAFSAIIASNLSNSITNSTVGAQKVVVLILSVVVSIYTNSVLMTLLFGLSALYAIQNFETYFF